MTPPRRGRGRPATFTTAAQARYLEARTGGATQKQAAALVGVTDRTVRNARRDPAFREADDAAAAARRQALAQEHLDQLPHDANRYKHHMCRCPLCTKAASADRAQSPDRTRRKPPADVTPIGQPAAEDPKAFPLARAS